MFAWLFQVLQSEGLHRYIDPRCLQSEISEATDVSPAELDRAARELVRTKNSPQSHNATSNHPGGANKSRPPYYEHLGGYSMQEMKDYNQYSRQDDLLNSQRGYSSQDYSDDNDDMVYVTTL